MSRLKFGSEGEGVSRSCCNPDGRDWALMFCAAPGEHLFTAVTSWDPSMQSTEPETQTAADPAPSTVHDLFAAVPSPAQAEQPLQPQVKELVAPDLCGTLSRWRAVRARRLVQAK